MQQVFCEHSSIDCCQRRGPTLYLGQNSAKYLFNSLWIVFESFGFSSRGLGHVMFRFAGIAQEAGADGRALVSFFEVH